MAIASEQENISKQAENRAQVVLAEAEIPRAIAEAFRSGNLGVMDYYKLRNVQADTSMREAIAKPQTVRKADDHHDPLHPRRAIAGQRAGVPHLPPGSGSSSRSSTDSKKAEEEKRKRLRAQLEGSVARPPQPFQPQVLRAVPVTKR
jgi:hypothetical protein